jgi:hypothetical protein
VKLKPSKVKSGKSKIMSESKREGAYVGGTSRWPILVPGKHVRICRNGIDVRVLRFVLCLEEEERL